MVVSVGLGYKTTSTNAEGQIAVGIDARRTARCPARSFAFTTSATYILLNYLFSVQLRQQIADIYLAFELTFGSR